MKEIKLEIVDTYENAVKHIYNNYEVTERTKFVYTRIVKTNAKMRRIKEFKNVYEFEEESCIILNDNKHKYNLYNKVCLPQPVGQGYVDFAAMGVD